MKINVRFDDSDSRVYDLNGDEIRSLLLCDGIGHDGLFFRICNKTFEETKDGYSLTVFAKKD
jgi:hypothetical protein